MIIMAIVLVFLVLNTICFAEEVKRPEQIYGVDTPMTKLMSKYYKVEEIKVVSVGQDMRDPDDVSVCFFLANSSGVDPFKIRDMRVAAKSWATIMDAIKFKPANLFTDVGGYTVPSAYAHAYREYYKYNSDRNYKMTLYDKEVRNLVQLKFMVNQFNLSPMEVMQKRSEGKNFTEMIMKRIEQKKENKEERTDGGDI